MENNLPPNQEVGIPTTAGQGEKMGSTIRKYTSDQIRYVLARWKDNDRDVIAAQFSAHFGIEINKKQVKYIKDTYAKRPDYIEEFGDLMTEKQRSRALQKEQAKTNLPQREEPKTGGTGLGIEATGNLTTGHTSATDSRHPRSEIPRETSVSMSPLNSAVFNDTLGTPTAASTPKRNHWANTPVTAAAGYLNLPVTTTAGYQNQAALLSGQSGLVSNTMPSPAMYAQTSPLQGYQNGSGYAQSFLQASGTAQGQHFITVGSPAGPVHQMSQNVGTIAVSPAKRASVSPPNCLPMPTQNTRVTPGQQFIQPSSSPAREASVSPQNHLPAQNRGTSAGLRNISAGSSSPSKRASVSPPDYPPAAKTQQMTLPRTGAPTQAAPVKPQLTLPRAGVPTQAALAKSQLTLPRAGVPTQAALEKSQSALPRAGVPTQTASILVQSPVTLSTGSAPPSHIQLPTQDFGKDGVWYSNIHDGCRIQGRHRHNNDGTIVNEAMEVIVAGTQGRKRATEGVNPQNATLAGKPIHAMSPAPGLVRQETAKPGSKTLAGGLEDTIKVAEPIRQLAPATPQGAQNPHPAVTGLSSSVHESSSNPASTRTGQLQQHISDHRAVLSQAPVPVLQQNQVPQTSHSQHAPQQVQQIQQNQHYQAAQLAYQLQQARDIQQARSTQKAKPARQAEKARRAPQFSNGTSSSQNPLAVTPQQQLSAAGVSSAHKPSQGGNSQSQPLASTAAGVHPGSKPQSHASNRQPNSQLPPAEVWLGVDPHSPSPIPTSSPDIIAGSANHYDTIAYDELKRLPDTINGEHFQHNLYDNFAHFPWSQNLVFDIVPIVANPRLEHRRSPQNSVSTTNNETMSSGRKRKANASPTTTGAENIMNIADSERAAKRPNLGGGVGTAAPTAGNPHD